MIKFIEGEWYKLTEKNGEMDNKFNIVSQTIVYEVKSGSIWRLFIIDQQEATTKINMNQTNMHLYVHVCVYIVIAGVYINK